MTKNRTIDVVLTILVAIVIIAAGALVVISNERSAFSNDLHAQTLKAEQARYLVDVSAGLQDELLSMEEATSRAANDLQGNGLNDSHARTVLTGVVNVSSNVINVVTTDINGTILAVEPSRYSSIEGKETGGQDTMKIVLEQGRPAMSPLDTVVEGFDATYIVYPIFDDQGKVVGAISTMFRIDWMMQNITVAHGNGDLRAMVMQGDGVVLYDVDADQVGRNTFTDPLYQNLTEIKALASRMVNESSGNGNYSFRVSGEEIGRIIVWTTVGVLGMRWTVAAIRAA